MLNKSDLAAQHFVERYYRALNSRHERGTLSSFYVQPTPINPIPTDISLNGNIIQSPAELQSLFQTKMPEAHYECQSYDCHVLNPNYNIGASEADLGPDKTGQKMSLVVVVSGYVKYGEARDAKMRGFTENFVLVPNFDAGKGRSKDVKKWLIQSQNFRIVF